MSFSLPHDLGLGTLTAADPRGRAITVTWPCEESEIRVFAHQVRHFHSFERAQPLGGLAYARPSCGFFFQPFAITVSFSAISSHRRAKGAVKADSL
jgi:hypothetical protein